MAIPGGIMRWLRSPLVLWGSNTLGISPKQSARFGVWPGQAQTGHGAFTFTGSTYAYWLAFTCWRINATQRWLDLPVTQFKLHDRLTHVEYNLDTDTQFVARPNPIWWKEENLDADIAFVLQQFQTGGPSAKGCHKFYLIDLWNSARVAWLQLLGLMWHDPPSGPGFSAMFGLKGRESFPAFVRDGVTLTTGFITWMPAGDYAWLENNAQRDYTDPPDYFQTHPSPRNQFSIASLDVLNPGQDVSTIPFTAIEWQPPATGINPPTGGTTPNAHHYPPDGVLWNEINADPNQCVTGTRNDNPEQWVSILNQSNGSITRYRNLPNETTRTKTAWAPQIGMDGTGVRSVSQAILDSIKNEGGGQLISTFAGLGMTDDRLGEFRRWTGHGTNSTAVPVWQLKLGHWFDWRFGSTFSRAIATVDATVGVEGYFHTGQTTIPLSLQFHIRYGDPPGGQIIGTISWSPTLTLQQRTATLIQNGMEIIVTDAVRAETESTIWIETAVKNGIGNHATVIPNPSGPGFVWSGWGASYNITATGNLFLEFDNTIIPPP